MWNRSGRVRPIEATRVLFVLLSVVILTWLPARPAVAAEPVVRLVIDFGDGSELHFTKLKATPGATVLQVMEAASKHPRGIKYQMKGRGATAFLTAINGVKNQGRDNNWVFRINDKLGETSFGTAKVKAGDNVRWTFGAYQP